MSDKSERESKHTFCVQYLYSPEYHAVYEVMWKNIVERCRPQITIWRMFIACWIPKATNTHSQHTILTAFPLQQWLHARSSMLRHMYIACLVQTGFGKERKEKINKFSLWLYCWRCRTRCYRINRRTYATSMRDRANVIWILRHRCCHNVSIVTHSHHLLVILTLP